MLPPLAWLCISFFELGLGVYLTFDTRVSCAAFFGADAAVGNGENWAIFFVVALFFPMVMSWLGPYTFLPFGVVLVETMVYTIWVFLDGVRRWGGEGGGC